MFIAKNRHLIITFFIILLGFIQPNANGQTKTNSASQIKKALQQHLQTLTKAAGRLQDSAQWGKQWMHMTVEIAFF